MNGLAIMEMAMRQMKFRAARKLLEKNGWFLDRVRGSHYIFKKDNKVFTLPWRKTLPKYVVKNLLKLL